jgi:hypothetical protein
MKSPYGLDIFDNCTACAVREQHLYLQSFPVLGAETECHHVRCSLSPRLYAVS